MRYRVMASTGDDYDYFYADDAERARVLYIMAIESKMFSYVALEEAETEYYTKQDWIDEE